ncbi:MAG: helix-turn-helix domain containing protein [Methylobacterium frigidaeris]
MRALGADAALALLLQFGGQTVNIPSRAGAKAPLIQAIGTDQVGRLRDVFGAGTLKVPMARSWCARRLDAEGVARAEIAKRLRVTRESVRLYLIDRKRRRAA